MPSQSTESSLLSGLLLPPAPLPLAIPLATFIDLFPRSHRSSPDIPLLYRELQYQVALGIDDVKRNIAAEVSKGEETRTRVARARRRAERGGADALADEMHVRMDVEMNGPTDNRTTADIHTERSIVQEMETACADLEEEIAEMEQEASSLLEELRTAVGDLSDLRYGRFTKASDSTDLGEDVIQSIKRLQEVCDEGEYPPSVR